MSDIDFFTKVHDGAQMIVDACKEKLEGLVPPRMMKAEASSFNTLPWESKDGGKGPYQQVTKEACANSEIFQSLQELLDKHNGFTQLGGFKYWTHQGNSDVIDRRKR